MLLYVSEIPGHELAKGITKKGTGYEAYTEQYIC